MASNKKVCVINVSHCLQVGWISSINELYSRQFIKANKSNSHALSRDSKIHKNELQEFSYILEDFKISKDQGK